jgi:hypothetical protein
MPNNIRRRVEVMAWALLAFLGQSIQTAAAQAPPEENRKELMEALGPPFIVFREKLLDELKVSDDQREKLMQRAMEQIMETGPFLNALSDTAPDRYNSSCRRPALHRLDVSASRGSSRLL